MNVHIKGPVSIIGNNAMVSIMQFKSCSILFSGEILFDTNYCHEVISLDTHIKVTEHANITFSNNKYLNDIIAVTSVEEYHQVNPPCLFQFSEISNNTRIEDLLTHYTIIFSDNIKHTIVLALPLQSNNNNNCTITFCYFMSHCKWISSSAFHNYNPEVINRQIIQYDDNTCYNHKHICYVSESKGINCSVDTLGIVYPGQTLRTNLCNMCNNDGSTILYAEVHSVDLPSSSCDIADQSQLVSIIGNHSNIVNYTITSSSPDNNRCELYLTATPFLNKIFDVFYVELLPCPIGFTLQGGICNCDPILLPSINKCNIDYSTISRPANIWITAASKTNKAKYLISDCPMDYCLPYSSYVNLLHTDLQCQFNRTGILCSHCKHHLSMVFGSSRCMKCINAHILITIIVLVAGIVLVVSIYLLNLTVTKGTINGIIFYANVVSINDSIFLVNDNVFKFLRVFMSFANLDLGIETCFYNGMYSYVKTWLQLFFPFYLKILAASIIMASRYSYRILRLTYTRSLPVLATLFLLSYTGVLRTVLTVLFSYSTITHLPSGHKQIVWSIDANVPLFGVKFTILFIICLVLFLLLIPFSIILLFTRYLLHFRINNFKPLLDAFQGSYKDKYYNWIAINIILRSLFFALYGFQAKLRLIITAMMLVLLTGYHGYVHPNKNKLVNIQEHLLLINLTIMYAVSLQYGDSIFSMVTNLLISLVCIQLLLIVLYHFFTYTCHCNIAMALHNGKQKIMQLCDKKHLQYASNDIMLLNIPERTYNYDEYQDGLVTDDFK